MVQTHPDAARLEPRDESSRQDRRGDLLRSPVILSRGTNTRFKFVPVDTGRGINRVSHKDRLESAEVSNSGLEVREDLRLILASEWFANSTRMSRFLHFVVNETLAGRTDQL